MLRILLIDDDADSLLRRGYVPRAKTAAALYESIGDEMSNHGSATSDGKPIRGVAHPPASRVSTGIPGLDSIMDGGFVSGGIYMITGRPGAGKTVLGNQVAFRRVKNGGRVVYATLLAETHGRLISHVKGFTFFDENAVGRDIVYLNGMAPLQAEGLDGLLRGVQRMVRDHRADLLVLDGMLPAAQLGVSELDYKKFVGALQSWVAIVECTVLVLSSGGLGPSTAPEHTMVDGIVELSTESSRMRTMRQLAVTKFRGSAFAEGRHSYLITGNGLEVYRRFETAYGDFDREREQPMAERIPCGIDGLDALFGGGLIKGSTTLLLGSSGAGKTVSSLQYLAHGARAGESVLYFGFYEPPDALMRKGDRLGLDLTGLRKTGRFHIAWRNPAEPLLDRDAHALIEIARQTKATRVVVDGFAGFRTADHPERLSAAFTVVSNLFTREGVTMVVTDETRELFIRDVEVPTQHVSALFHNIVFLRQVELDARLLRLLSVMKMRDSHHDSRLWEIEITDAGVSVTAPFGRHERSLMGGGESRVLGTETDK